MSFISKNHKVFFLLFICIITWIVYFNSLQVPFYLDDIRSISNNQLLQTGSFFEIAQAHGMRAVSYLSFAFDYKISGEISQLHISNILVHMLNGSLVFVLFQLLLFKTPNGIVQIAKHNNTLTAYIPLIGALLFIVHPLHTQAVTYIVQRSASLAALFYLAALCSYISLRVQPKHAIKFVFFICFTVFFVLALFTKQNTATLPLVLFALELTLFKKLKLQHLLIAFITVSASVLITYLVDSALVTKIALIIDAKTRENDVYTRLDYFLAQMSVLWLYIGKFFFPYPLRLEYPYQVNDFPLWQSIVAGVAHIALITMALIYRKRFPLLCFALAFYYIAHLVESGLVPIKDIAVEHRTYLPNVGLVLVTTFSLILLANKTKIKSIALVFTAIFLALSTTTIYRNNQWLNPVTFYQNELSYSPYNCRILSNLADIYSKQGNADRAFKQIELCVNNSVQGLKNPEIVNNYIALLGQTNQANKAINTSIQALSWVKDPVARRRILANVGILLMQQKKLVKAAHYLKQAVSLPNPLANTFFALSVTLAKLGKIQEAHSYVVKGLLISPTNSRGLKILAKLNQLTTHN